MNYRQKAELEKMGEDAKRLAESAFPEVSWEDVVPQIKKAASKCARA